MTTASTCATLLRFFAIGLCLSVVLQGQTLPSTWPQRYSIQRDDAPGLLTLITPYYAVQHNLKKGGAIAKIQIAYGQETNLLIQPLATSIRDEHGAFFTDLNDSSATVSCRPDGLIEIVTVESRLLDAQNQPSGIQLKTVFEYHWGYIKIHKEFIVTANSIAVTELCPVSTILASSLNNYGYREGITELEGAPPFSFGSCRWGKLRSQNPADPVLKTAILPRYLMLASPGVEGLEWFMSSNLAQWDLQITKHRGQGQCLLQTSQNPVGLALSISAYQSSKNTISLSNTNVFDYYLGIPMREGHAQKPWFHASFNRNKGNWVAPEQVRHWAEQGIQTVHCHNDGDYYDDGLFWRDGSYPPYPDMDKYDKVIEECHRNGIRVATYFSNKELHPSTKEFQEHGAEWGRKDHKGNLQHNYFRGKSEFGVQMCLRSGWLDFLKSSINRVLSNHPLDGVYYDWNVALLCGNGLHEAKTGGPGAPAHWDIDELLNLMEWTRNRVGPNGLVIVHNTTTPMFATENFADNVVANEWGYGKWTDQGPALADLPLEWSLAGARSRGVISYGQLDSQSPKRLHHLFALEALLGGVTPWPASTEAIELYSVLKPIGNIETCLFADWRNQAVTLQGTRCASTVYSRPNEAYLLLANLDKNPQDIKCIVHPERLPYPLSTPVAATVISTAPGMGKSPDPKESLNIAARQLVREGLKITVPADGAVLVHIR